MVHGTDDIIDKTDVGCPFVVGDIFEYQSARWKKERPFDISSDISNFPTQEFNLPLVSAKCGNNGIMYYGRSADFDSAEMTIGIVTDGKQSAGKIYAHTERTGILYNAYLIKPITVFITREILLYLTCCLRKSICRKYSHDVKPSWKKVSKEIIFLPVKDKAPDWAYMDRYITNVEKDIIRGLQENNSLHLVKSMKALGIDSFEITERELETLSRMQQTCAEEETDQYRLRKYKLSDFFIIRSTRGTDFDKMQFTENGPYDFVGQRIDNYGVQGKVKKLGYEPNPEKTFSLSQDGNWVCFWRSRKWYASQNIFMLEPKYKEISDTFLFFQTVINTGLKQNWSHCELFPHIQDLENQEIAVPVNLEDNVAFDFIKEFLTALSKQVVIDLSERMRRQIAAYKLFLNSDYEENVSGEVPKKRPPSTNFILGTAIERKRWHGMRSIAAQHGFVFLPYNKESIYLRHFSNEPARFYKWIKAKGIQVNGLPETGTLSLMSRLLLLYLEYWSLYSREKQEGKNLVRMVIDNSGFLYNLPSLHKLEDLLGKQNNIRYFFQKVTNAIIELQHITYYAPDQKKKEIPLLEKRDFSTEPVKNTGKDFTFNMKLSDTYVERLTKLMLYPREGFHIENLKKDAVFFYLMSYISYRFSATQNIDERYMKISVLPLLEHIPVFPSYAELKENRHSKYME